MRAKVASGGFPVRGECLVYGQDVNHLPQRQRTRFRGTTIGFVFQAFNLLPTLNAAENVAVPLFINGFNGPTTAQTAVQAGLGRNDRRTIVGGRWEHDFDNQTTWRNQFVFDDRDISQPTGATSAIGDFPSINVITDVTKKATLFGFDSTSIVGAYFNTMSWRSNTINVRPGGDARLGLISSSVASSSTRPCRMPSRMS